MEVPPGRDGFTSRIPGGCWQNGRLRSEPAANSRAIRCIDDGFSKTTTFQTPLVPFLEIVCFAFQPACARQPVGSEIEISDCRLRASGIEGQIEKRVGHFPRTSGPLSRGQQVECMAQCVPARPLRQRVQAGGVPSRISRARKKEGLT